MTTYANRGMPFEGFIEYANSRYRAAGIAVVEKQHTHFVPIRNRKGKIVRCKVEEKATVDFMGRYKDIPVAIEVKHTNSRRIRLKEVKEHQRKFLDDFTKYPGTFGAVLVSFGLERFFLVPWDFWRFAIKSWDSGGDQIHARICGAEFDWKVMASISEDEIPEEWEVKPNNKYGLAYLSKIDTYMNNYVKE